MYPENCLRGIQQKDKILEDGLVASDVFYFDDDHVRENGVFEQSINWEDDENAVSFTLSQRRKDNTPQFKGGIAIIARCELDKLAKFPAVVGEALYYERQIKDDNLYHGNLLLSAAISKPKRRAIAATLALHVSRVIPQPTA
jgi:hypothetical protein